MFRCCVFSLPCCPSRFALDTSVSPTTEGASVSQKVSPPSYAAVAGPTTSHHHHNHHHITSPLTSPPSSSSVYPAVLVGRANSESKMKVPPPVPPRGTPKVKRGGATCTTTTSATGKGDNTFSLHAVFRYPLFLHDALDRITCLVRNGRVFGDPSEQLFESDTEGVCLKRFRRIDAFSDRKEVYFSPTVSDIFVNNDFCRVHVDDKDVV